MSMREYQIIRNWAAKRIELYQRKQKTVPNLHEDVIGELETIMAMVDVIDEPVAKTKEDIMRNVELVSRI